jgi:glycyl-tRNA synthetase beta chain
MEKLVDFLFEINCEEIPARMQLDAQKKMEDLFKSILSEFGITFHCIKSFITPRKQVIKAEIAKTTKELIEEKRGPKIDAPEIARSNFLKNNHLKEEDLVQNNGYYYAYIKKRSLNTKDLLPEIFEKMFRSMSWPKVMRYPGSTISWVRPIRSILCLLDNEPQYINFSYLGITSSNKTVGHRFMGTSEKEVSCIEEYLSFLKKEYVVLSHEERQDQIRKELTNLAKEKDIEWIEDLCLLQEVAGLVEYPFVHLGNIEERFMHLPACVLATSMKVHQKYFVFKQKQSDQLAPYFGVVANTKPLDPSLMLKGFEKVLTARLTDALFFFDVDVKVSLFEQNHKLASITYHNQLGSLKDKLDRMKSNDFFIKTDKLETAITLSKSDLLTQMVGEFAELQGKMGHIYAKLQKIEEDVAIAIEEYYMPQGPHDDLPSNEIGNKLSLLDKMDALVGFIKIGLKPTGSKDPFALRRQALGIIRILLSDSFKMVNLEKFIKDTQKTFSFLDATTFIDVRDFILERFLHFLKEDFSISIITSVLKTLTDSSPIYLYTLKKRIEALSSFLQSSSGEQLKALHKRAIGVIDNAYKIVNEGLFETDHEKNFFKALVQVEEKIQIYIEEEKYTDVMAELSTLQKEMTIFFDNVHINVENQDIKENRKALIKRFLNNIMLIADFKYL